MKEIYGKVLLEMISNCRRSDRELAKALDVSQPTVTRARAWLERNNFVKEYTLIPDFSKIDLELVAFTFIKIRPKATMEKFNEIRKKANIFFEKHPNVILALKGDGMGCDGIVVSLHKDFAKFTQFLRELKTETINTEVVGNFLASLKTADQYRNLTFKTLKEYIKNDEHAFNF